MYEITCVRQDDPDLKCRWFTTENCNLDLYIWEHRENRNIVRFQFYFNRQQDEKVIEWKGTRQLWYARVDEGDYKRLYKAAPILLEENTVDLHEALVIFRAYSRELEEGIRRFVEQRFLERLPRVC